MIVRSMVETYIKFNGDIDGFARSRSPDASVVRTPDVPDAVWSTIDGLVQDLRLIRRGLASGDYERQVMERLGDFDADAQAALRAYA
jgi:hypothetical protein